MKELSRRQFVGYSLAAACLAGTRAESRSESTAVRAAIADGRLAGDGKVAARATITLEGLGAETVITGDIELV